MEAAPSPLPFFLSGLNIWSQNVNHFALKIVLNASTVNIVFAKKKKTRKIGGGGNVGWGGEDGVLETH